MVRTPISLKTFALPVLFIGTLQLAGCSGKIAPPDPGGVYRSTSGGGSFEQSVSLVDNAGELIGYIDQLPIQTIHRPPHRTETIYATAGQQGLHVSQDNGVTWRFVKQPLTSLTAITHLANNVILISGTNEVNEGIVLRSLDGGKSWLKVLTIPAPPKPPSSFFQIIKPPPHPPVFVSSLTINPFQDNQVYATTSTGDVLLGQESGKTWKTVLRIQSAKTNPLTGFRNAPVKSIVPSPHEENEVLLVGKDGRLIRSIDGKEDKEFKTPKGHVIVDVAYVSQFPDALLVGTTKGGIISRDRGRTWVDLELPISKTTAASNVIVRLSPTNPNRYLISVDSVVYRSEDGGNTWNSYSLELPNHLINDISIDPNNASNVLAVVAPVKS